MTMSTEAFPGAELFLPPVLSLTSLRDSARSCRGCPLYKDATQTVFGSGPRSAAIVLVGEQPGDDEDKAGKPFVGPAGQILNRALEAAGIERVDVYITNVVKHFKFLIRGWRRWHKRPSKRDIDACMAWMEAELEVIKPKVLVCLGATAAQALLDSSLRITVSRGRDIATRYAAHAVATIHPSAILRQPTDSQRDLEMERFIHDLRFAAGLAGATP
jgi:DNA polymerase